jgi:membrane protease YdiL (CAAX protease family)
MEEPQVWDRETAFRWRKRDLITFALFFAATVFFVPMIAFLIMRGFQPGLRLEDLSGVQQILIQAAMDVVWVIFILFLIRAFHGRPILRTLRFVRVENLSIAKLTAGGAFLALMVLIASVLLPTPSESPLEKLLTTTASLALFVFFGIAVAPLLEEIVFRGFLFTALTDVYGEGTAVPVTAVLFAGLHGIQLRGNLAALALIFVVGYVLTVVRRNSNSVVPSVIMHTAYNAMIFGVSALVSVLGYDEQR